MTVYLSSLSLDFSDFLMLFVKFVVRAMMLNFLSEFEEFTTVDSRWLSIVEGQFTHSWATDRGTPL